MSERTIAIVGLALRFPGANNQDQFWHNLTNKISSIGEIPIERWDWRESFSPNPKKDQQKSMSKWGGFIDNIDLFDTSFFAISPTEAKSMDPQQRLSLELAWQCLEDAGIAPVDIKNTDTGVYLGCSNTDYQEFSAGNIDPHFLTGMSTGVFANRISHYFNLQGPSETVDTACSSSLVAIHKAINDFNSGQINAALVGGVNLLMTNSRYVSFSKLGVLSPTGECKTLDASADGYVRGEGVGMVMLLPLERAIAMHCTIYGIIQGTSVSHSGKTKTLTSPSPFSQSRAIQQALQNAKLSSNQISYIELHGTGTVLGDPIEIQGIKRAFRATKAADIPSQDCYLTTVKTNIGHLESGAGIAGLIKVLLSIRHKKIPPLQNFKDLNKKISLDKTSLKLATQTTDWQTKDNQPRIAGISSFGFAGVNAHVIISEPPSLELSKEQPSLSEGTPNSEQIILLSAKTTDALVQRASQLKDAIKQDKNYTIEDIAYTLQIGREHMKHRWGCVAITLEELISQLEQFTANPELKNNQIITENQTLKAWLNNQEVNLNDFTNPNKNCINNLNPTRISLPGYPFNGKKLWIESRGNSINQTDSNQLHALVQQNKPALNELLYTSTFNGNEFFLTDHQVNQQAILPGVCTLEMVYQALNLANLISPNSSVTISDIRWLRPITANLPIKISIISHAENTFNFTVSDDQQANWQVYAQGQACIQNNEQNSESHQAPINLSLQNTNLDIIQQQDIYHSFNQVGIKYGPAFANLQWIKRQNDTAFGLVKVDSRYTKDFTFAPSLLDTALHTLMCFYPKGQLALPFAIKKVRLIKPLTTTDEILIKAEKISAEEFNLSICNQQGELYVEINGFSTRSVNLDTLTSLKPIWQHYICKSTKEPVSGHYIGPNQYKPDFCQPFKDTKTDKIKHLIYVATEQYTHPVELFKLLKQLDNQKLAITVLVESPQGCGNIGLILSAVQEYSNWHVRVIELETISQLNSTDITEHHLWQSINNLSLDAGRYKFSHNNFYQYAIANLQTPLNQPTTHKHRQNGVYVIFGGAGGLGQVYSKWLIEKLDAQVIWLGRREQNTAISQSIKELQNLSKSNKAPVYLSADACDYQACEQALSQVKAQFGSINALVHCVIHLDDQTLANMTEEQFLQGYQAKQQSGDVLFRLAKNQQLITTESLDLVLFFSSLQSFSPAYGQSNYAAGCTYLDSLALSYESQLPIKIINWGYWGSVGIVQDEFYQKRMEKAGIGSIEPAQGMQALARFIDSQHTQLGVVKMSQELVSKSIQYHSYELSQDMPTKTSTLQPINVKAAYGNSAILHQQLNHKDKLLPHLIGALQQANWSLTGENEQQLNQLPEYFKLWWQQTSHYLADINEQQANKLAASATEQFANPLINQCLTQLPDILNGTRPATEVLFPKGSLELVQSVYQNNPVADYANQVLVESLTSVLNQLTQNSNDEVTILEVGAGTGGTTTQVLPALKDFTVTEYCYTDLSKVFLDHANNTFAGSYRFVKPQYFDISRPLKEQDIKLGHYDVVIATNVLHATSNIANTLQNAKACLKKSGVLLINELVEKSLFTQLTFGLLQGWWLSEDQQIRQQGSPLLSTSMWQQILRQLGFSQVLVATDDQSPQQIIIAQSDGLILQAPDVKKCVKKATKNATNTVAHSSQKPQGVHKNQHVNSDTISKHVEQVLFAVASEALSIDAKELDPEESYADYGVDSILAVQMLEDINERFDLSLPATLLFDYPSIATLGAYITDQYGDHIAAQIQLSPIQETQIQTPNQVTEAIVDPSNIQPIDSHQAIEQQKPINTTEQNQGIAVIGMSCQFGSAANVDEFWSLLVNKQTSVKAQQRWDLSALNTNQQSWCRYASLLDNVSHFDAGFFSISPQEAMYMDPQQRLFLQHSYLALENANIITQVAEQSVGVYLGCAQGDYLKLAGEDTPAQAFWGNAGSVIPARVSYFLNLKGPALAIDTACSSSLVAIHHGVQALKNREIDCAIAGGVTTLCTPSFSTHAGKAGMLSPDGKCYTFDDRANGFVPGEGVGAVILKRLDDAIDDNNNIYGVIIGSQCNQDGTTSGITAPNSLSQQQLHQQIYQRFNIDPNTISFIETHGTGTKLGDPIEFNALKRAFANQGATTNKSCALGSVKTNIGHCLTAAGIAGFIKTLLALKHQSIPASLNFKTANGHIDLDDSPFYINSTLIPWPSKNDAPRRAGVSSFGFSGTNAHILIEQYQQAKLPHKTPQQDMVLMLSAKTKQALLLKAEQLVTWITSHKPQQQQFYDIAYTLSMHREPMDHRLAFVASTISQAKTQLEQFITDSKGVSTGRFSSITTGDIKQSRDIIGALDQQDFARWLEQNALQKLSAFWVHGAKIDWSVLYNDSELNGDIAIANKRTIPLPGYPFAPHSHWIPDLPLQFDNPIPIAELKSNAILCQYEPIWLDKPLSETVAFHKDDHIVHTLSLDGDIELETEQLIEHIQQLGNDQLKITDASKPTLLQVVVDQNNSQLLALSGILKTAALEHSNLNTRLILTNDSIDYSLLQQEAQLSLDNIVRYNPHRQVLTYQSIETQANLTHSPPIIFKDTGVYLITGGHGQVGQIFCQEILDQASKATVILTGRSVESHEQNINSHRVHYYQSDISNLASCQTLIDTIEKSHGKISGIIHGAGVTNDQLICHKDQSQIKEVFGPKVNGIQAIDEASAQLDLDFFVAFSSIAAITGNLGQSDYATANAFMDQFITLRQEQVSQGTRQGLSLSINWPVWELNPNLGMHIDPVKQQLLAQQGLIPMPKKQGLKAFYQAFASFDNDNNRPSQQIFFYGDEQKLKHLTTSASHHAQTKNNSEVKDPSDNEQNSDLEQYLANLIHQVSKLPLNQIDHSLSFDDMGFDSIMSLTIVKHLQEDLNLDFNQLPPSLMFELTTLGQLNNYLKDIVKDIPKSLNQHTMQKPSSNKQQQIPLQQTKTLKTQQSPSFSGPLDLSKTQLGLWLVQKQQPHSTANNVPLVFELGASSIYNQVNNKGYSQRSVNKNSEANSIIKRIQSSLDTLAMSHPVLRLCISELNGQPQQQLAPSAPIITVKSVTVASKDELIELINASINQAFVVDSQGPVSDDTELCANLLWRAQYWQVNLNGQYLELMVLVFHHLIIDGLSTIKLYEQFCQQNFPQTPDLGFFDYIEWEKQMLCSAQGKEHKDYWRQQLSGELPVIIPPLNNTQARNMRQVQHRISGHQYQQVLSFFTAHDSKAPMAFLTAYQLAVREILYSAINIHSDDVIIAMPVMHRPSPKMADSLGLFVNQLPLRNSVNAHQSFSSIAKRNQKLLLEMIDHAPLPFSQIVSSCNVQRQANVHPVFQIGFAYHNFINENWQQSNAMLVDNLWQEFAQQPALDLNFEVLPLNQEFILTFKFNANAYPREIISQLMVKLLSILQLNDTPPNDSFTGGGDTFAPAPARPSSTTPSTQSITSRFEAIATQSNIANKTALVFGQQTLTYSQLNEKTNVLASFIQNRAYDQTTIGQTVIAQPKIALCVPPSIDLIIGILAILKTGAAYIPIDPYSAPERMTYILQDARVDLLIVQNHQSNPFASNTVNTIALDDYLAPHVVASKSLPLELNKPDSAHNNVHAKPDDLAYIIYTSGSTGKPKGVMVKQQNVLDLFDNCQSLFNFNHHDTWCLFHSFAFDFSVWEIFGALLHGGKLAIVDNITRKDSAMFYDFIRRHQVSVLNQTPSAFMPLMDIMLSEQSLPELRYIIFGGEALDFNRLQPWFNTPTYAANSSKAQLINMYGITETTVHVTYLPITPQLIAKAQTKQSNSSAHSTNHNTNHSNIGKPLPGYQMLLLNEQLQAINPGEIGEIHVAGCGVTKGYHNQVELTAKRFININGFNLYKTGDLARQASDGNYYYVGRCDDQVQIRGFRIELGEVEQAIKALDYVQDACVLAIDKRQGKTLIAFVHCPLKQLTNNEIKSHLTANLPDYMVPTFIHFVSKMPLTNNGKIDKQALLNTTINEPIPQRVTPFQTETANLQAQISQICQEILDIEQIDINVPFFELGGDSLSANILAAKIRAQLGITIAITDIFQHPTVAKLSQFVDNQCAENQFIESQTASSHSESTGFAEAKVTQVVSKMPEQQRQNSVAIIGLSCHYPHSKNQWQFWKNLSAGNDLVNRIQSDDFSENINDDTITWVDSWLDEQDCFDAEFFNLSDKNARTMSYSTRQLLQHSYQAIANAGYIPHQLDCESTTTGVYYSNSGMDTPELNLQQKIQDDKFVLNAEDYVASTLNQPGTLPTLVSYHLGLTGPSIFVHSNCSSSLVAVGLAVDAIKTAKIDQALVGAACLFPHRYTGYKYEKGLNFAKDGRCKVFDSNADGMIGGNGVAVIMLKNTEQAIQDNDHIYALIKGVSINNDGKSRAGFFAPGVDGQVAAIKKALDDAQVSPASISYIETHGTGTALGDPIEFAALTQAYTHNHGNNKAKCALGAVKSTLGHTDTLAGLTGLIKTILALKYQRIPASLHYQTPNPNIDLANSPFYIQKQTEPWNVDDTAMGIRRAAVSAFGIGGTNAHAIVEEYQPQPIHQRQALLPAIIVLSAQNQQVLVKQATALVEFIELSKLTDAHLPSLACTLQTTREVFNLRWATVTHSIEQLGEDLKILINNKQTKIPNDTSEQQLANRWLNTGFSDWSDLYQGDTSGLTKMSLPSEPFSGKQYPLLRSKPSSAPIAHSLHAEQQTTSSLSLKAAVFMDDPIDLQTKLSASNSDASKQPEHHVIFCEIAPVRVPNANHHSLFSSHFTIDEKISDYGVQLLEITQQISRQKSHANTPKAIVIQLVLSRHDAPNLYLCFHALLKTVALECTNIDCQVILLESANSQEHANILTSNLSSLKDNVIRYYKGLRQTLNYPVLSNQTNPETQKNAVWQQQGVYLITGGLGGIGSIFISEILKSCPDATIIATGRGKLDDLSVEQQLAKFNTNTDDIKQVHYYRLDVSNKTQVIICIREILAKFQKLNGIIHCAGILQDMRFINKQPHSFRQVLAPKVTGVVALDEASQDLHLDFFACFAGLSGVNGAYTQVDYATANAFLDSYMHYRNNLCKQGLRHGKSCALDWPYWQNGGMKINPEFAKTIKPMPSQLGISAFYQALSSANKHNQILIEYHDKSSVRDGDRQAQSTTVQASIPAPIDLHETLQNIACDVLGKTPGSIDPKTDLGDAGADSIAYVSFINQINKIYQLDLSPSILFKHSSLAAIKEHIESEYSHTVQLQAQQQQAAQSPEQRQNQQHSKKVAIIGMSGQFPQAKNIAQFWQNLQQGKDCVGLAPWQNISQSDIPPEANFLATIDKLDDFDPLFFNISPAEGKKIPSQERLLMTHVYQCIENAGYQPKALAGTNTSIFVGCQAAFVDGMVISPSFAPNRMSYFLDLHGPSEGIDTTCSSSLVAVHKGCDAILQGTSTMAIVGGVNVIESPAASIALADMGALSKTGRCKAFAKDADGFVRGEGVGMIMLKNLNQAIADNDKISATIIGSGTNHGGKSQGFTVPNAKAQSQLLTDTWQKHNIDPASLSYIECHGTGTSLGDPIEIDALKDAFKSINGQSLNSQCAIGSVKSNIGHLEVSAGIAGLIKVVLQMQHQSLVPSIHSQTLNPYLAIQNSPFNVQQQLEHWQATAIRRAGVSSFGISGVNAHAVLEEYQYPNNKVACVTSDAKQPAKQPSWLLLNNNWQACPLPSKTMISSSTEPNALSPIKIIALEANQKSAFENQGFAVSTDINDIEKDNNLLISIVPNDNAIEHIYNTLMALKPYEGYPLNLTFAIKPSGQKDHGPRLDLASLVRSYTMRNPNHQTSLIEFQDTLGHWQQTLGDEIKGQLNVKHWPNHIIYKNDQRLGFELNRFPSPLKSINASPTCFKQGGTYLIAGALGELGIQLCRKLIDQYNTRLILLGRKSLSQAQASLTKLTNINKKTPIHYLQTDISDKSQVANVKAFIESQSLTLNGIFHLGTSFSEQEQSIDDFTKAMAVKVQGTKNLDEVFANDQLDFFIMFASMAVFGSLNHLSYSYGNGYQNYFAATRQNQVNLEQRSGKTLALNWGYWHSDDSVKSIENNFAVKKGYALITMDNAFSMLDSLLGQANCPTTVGVVYADKPDNIAANTGKLLISSKQSKMQSVNNQKPLKPAPSSSKGAQVHNQDIKTVVVNTISQILEIPAADLDLNLDLDQYGFDSIALLKTFQSLKQQLNIDIQADAFKNMNTIASLISELEQQHHHKVTSVQKQDQKPEFIKAAGLNLNTKGLKPAFKTAPKAILLTGATGFLGGHILTELLATTKAKIYCIVRANTRKQAIERIKRNAQQYQLNIDTKRIEPMLGDMEKANLGLSQKNHQILCKNIEHIVHTASYVNHIQPYFAFKKSVAGTGELLTIAATDTIKMIHFVSSTTVSNQVNNSHFTVNPTEGFINSQEAELILSGYGQSKWVQEENIRLASIQGVPHTVYRFSEIACSSTTGLGNTGDIFHRILQMMLHVDVKPQPSDYVLDIIPVDKAAKIVACGLNHKDKRNKVFNVANKKALGIKAFYQFAENAGLQFKDANKQSFINACQTYVSNLAEGDDKVIMQGLLTSRPGYDEYLFESYLLAIEQYDKDNFLWLLEQFDIELSDWPSLFATYFKQWQQSGYCS